MGTTEILRSPLTAPLPAPVFDLFAGGLLNAVPFCGNPPRSYIMFLAPKVLFFSEL
jgi:hypothetical protein